VENYKLFLRVRARSVDRIWRQAEVDESGNTDITLVASGKAKSRIHLRTVRQTASTVAVRSPAGRHGNILYLPAQSLTVRRPGIALVGSLGGVGHEVDGIVFRLHIRGRVSRLTKVVRKTAVQPSISLKEIVPAGDESESF
jgi:hypothetical protein